MFRFIMLIASTIVALGSQSFAHEAPIRVVVLGEDSDRNAVSRSSEIYTRVVAELQQSLIRENITVIDEDMIAVKLGFSYNTDRTKQELIQTLSIANETTDATVRSRLGVIFAIFPNIRGTTMRKEKRAALVLSLPRSTEVEIVAPDLEMPGSIAIA